jgi:dolichol-phosphate mannosyltransferase
MRPANEAPPDDSVSLSVVIPVCNEAENVTLLVQEIHTALHFGESYEIVFVDDGSTDPTRDVIRMLRADHPETIRLVCHPVRCGQSAALCSGVRAARANWVITLDGDGQNDPADIPTLVRTAAQAHSAERLHLVMGHRVSRRDTWVRRVSSRIANSVRRCLLKDGTPDTGCGIKMFHRQTFLTLPTFNHMHRFLPALFLRAGSKVISTPVNHRPRIRGESKYGIQNRLWVGIVDLFGVRWLILRTPEACDARED